MIDEEPEDRRDEVLAVVLKFLGITLGIGLFIGGGTCIAVRSLDLNSGNNNPIGSPDPVSSLAPLPTTAITETPSATPTPTETPTEEPTDQFSEFPTDIPTVPPTGEPSDLVLSVSPVFVEPMQRVNLEGDWPGHDGVSLSVQRFEEGEWVDFGIQVQVKDGSYKTYVQTSHEGKNMFRMYDENSGTASNEATVTIGS